MGLELAAPFICILALALVPPHPVAAPSLPRHRSREFLKFLHQLEQRARSDLQIHLIVDNASSHKSAEVKHWLAELAFMFISTQPAVHGSTSGTPVRDHHGPGDPAGNLSQCHRIGNCDLHRARLMELIAQTIYLDRSCGFHHRESSALQRATWDGTIAFGTSGPWSGSRSVHWPCRFPNSASTATACRRGGAWG